MLLNRGERRSYLIHRTSIDTLKKIRYLLDQGNQRTQIEEILQQTETLTIQTDDDEMNEYMMTLPQLHREMAKEIKRLNEQSERQTDLLKELAERMDQQQNYIDKRLDERDQVLMQGINELLEAKKQLAAAEEEKKKGFFARLFKK